MVCLFKVEGLGFQEATKPRRRAASPQVLPAATALQPYSLTALNPNP